MDPEIKQIILDLIHRADRFVVDTAPHVVRDVLLWAQLKFICPLVFLVLLVVISVVVSKRIKKEDLDAPPFILLLLFGFILCFMVTLFVLFTIGDAIHATFAPYSYLLKNLR